jgi:ABC-type lipopolysaccharide export system ATPase subunit
MSGTQPKAIEKIENGKSLQPRYIIEIALALKVNPAWLQFGEPWAKKDLPWQVAKLNHIKRD